MQYSFQTLVNHLVKIEPVLLQFIGLVFFILLIYIILGGLYKKLSAFLVDYRLTSRKISTINCIKNKYHNINKLLRGCKTKILELEKFKPLNLPAEELIWHASYQEIGFLGNVLKDKSCSKSNAIKLIRSAGSHSIASTGRRLAKRSPYISFREVVNDVGRRMGVSNINILNEIQLENAIVEKAYKKGLDKMSKEDRADFEAKLFEVANEHGKKYKAITSSSATLAIAQASGFGIYLMASTLVGATANLVGATLPFIFYASMSKSIAICIGPLGWGFLGLWGIHKLGAPNYKKTVPAVIAITSIRYRLEMERQGELSINQDEVKYLLENKDHHQNELNNLLDDLKNVLHSLKYTHNIIKINNAIKDVCQLLNT